MNEIFIIGKIINKIEFKFIINKRNYFSKVNFMLKSKDKQILKIIAYNEIADYCYKKIKEEDNILIVGKVNTKMEIEVKEIYIL